LDGSRSAPSGVWVRIEAGEKRRKRARGSRGRTNQAVARALFITGGVVEKHAKGIFGKLGLGQSEADHRRVPAVLAYLHDQSSRNSGIR
jgi:hypothetical protein